MCVMHTMHRMEYICVYKCYVMYWIFVYVCVSMDRWMDGRMNECNVCVLFTPITHYVNLKAMIMH